MDNNKFIVNKDGVKYEAKFISKFNLLDNEYCIYAIPIGNHNNMVCCDRLIDNNLVSIVDEEEKKLVSAMVKKLLEPLKNIN